ncbi:MAG: histidine phosphatase family protein [Parasporobacterium sp.]|nr:histidine phosphatase family protein [Parasporobacterium sp.]
MAHKTVYLIRHAVTNGNAEGRYIGRTDEPLAGGGGPQTRPPKVHPCRAPKVHRVAASPMKRAVQTAQILFGGMELTKIDELREIDFGYFEGRNHRELNGDPVYQAWIDSNGQADIPGGERRSDFVQRSYAGFIKALGDPKKDETIAIVCHGGNIMAVLSTLTGKDYYDFQTGNLSGYCLDLETDDEGIHDLTYTRIDPWDPA